MKPIKFVDLIAQNEEIGPEVASAFDEIHSKASYVGGPQVAAFERAFAEFLGTRHVVGVNSGTDALHLTLRALDVSAGDEVITSPFTFIGTVEAIVQTGARPAFVDIDPSTCNISPSAIRDYMERGRFGTSSGPKVIMPVHLYGLPAPMEELRSIADHYGLRIVEDACQAHGAKVALANGWVRAGAAGTAGCFSFYAAKNLGAWGEAGAVATDDTELATQVALLRDHGRVSHYSHQECGYNSRLDSLQAAVLHAKLKRLDQWNAQRREIANSYCKLLNGLDLILPSEPEYAKSCYHLFVIRSRRRDALRDALLGEQIECGVHYPIPLHLQPALRRYNLRHGNLSTSESAADTVLSLPMHPHLSESEIGRVAEVVARSLEDDSNLFRVDSQMNSANVSPNRSA